MFYLRAQVNTIDLVTELGVLALEGLSFTLNV
jgi:hypothetical protein